MAAPNYMFLVRALARAAKARSIFVNVCFLFKTHISDDIR